MGRDKTKRRQADALADVEAPKDAGFGVAVRRRSSEKR
jgi:hypothetical protein